MGKDTVDPLPESYTAVTEVFIPNEIFVPKLNFNAPIQPHVPPLLETINDGYKWVEHVYTLLDKAELSQRDWISWAAYHADIKDQDGIMPPCTSLSWMLPMFKDLATNPMLMYHCMKLTK